MEFHVLGRLEVIDGGRDVTPARPKQRALLALLLLRAGEVVTVDEALDALWGEAPPPAARNALQGHVTALRKLLGPDRIETREGYLLRLGDDELDLDRFERLVTDARDRPPEERAALLGEALGLFRGDPLEDFRYDTFARGEAARIEELRVAAREERVDADLALGRHNEVVPELEHLVAEQPLRERLHGQLMLALYRSGRQVDALEAYRRARRILAELGLEPAPALRRLESQILNQDPALDLPPDVRDELPTPPTPLLGRELELTEAMELLLRPDVRIVTLAGPGGTGKTRLALELARRGLRNFRHGACFVPLAPLADAALVLPTIARALGVIESGARPLEETLSTHLAEREVLVVLDNFEHLLPAAGAIGRLVSAAPSMKLLLTSRESLRIYGEHLYHVPPLQAEPAERLFLDRARAVQPDLDHDDAATAVAEICRRLDRLPLAIELAAARTTNLSPQALLERLDERLDLLVVGALDQPERLQTLRRTLEWSHDLLMGEEQRLFARLAVFAGGCTVDAAASVCGDEVDVVGGLSSLIDKSLLQVGATDPAPRPTMLETIREYATERLEQSGEAGRVRRRHAEHFLAFAEEAEPDLPLSPRELLDRLERDHDNLRAALEWFESTKETQGALRLAGALWRFWYLRGHLTEGRRRIEAALAADDRPTHGRAKALNGAAAFAINGGDIASAKHFAEAARALHRQLGDVAGAAYADFMLGNVLADEGDLEQAERLYEESVHAFRDVGAEHWALLASRHLAYTYERLGDGARARTAHENNLRLARETGNPRIAATSLGALAEYAVEDGCIGDAASMLVESLRIHSELGDLLDTAVDLCLYASVLARTGRPATAARLVASLESSSDEVGVRGVQIASTNAETLAAVRSQLDEAEFAEAWEHGGTLTVDEAVALALEPLGD